MTGPNLVDIAERVGNANIPATIDKGRRRLKSIWNELIENPRPKRQKSKPAVAPGHRFKSQREVDEMVARGQAAVEHFRRQRKLRGK